MDWHKRYLQQATWTQSLRTYLLGLINFQNANRILEVGCGTGAILQELEQTWLPLRAAGCSLHGLDVASELLSSAADNASAALLTRGDALHLPYAEGSFDVTLCHFLLLWVKYPDGALQEMKRVTRSGGHVLALAEPDYDARQDSPDELAILGMWQATSLEQQGANVAVGRQLAELFRRAGLRILEAGALQPWPQEALTAEALSAEWEVLRHDLAGLVPALELDRLMGLDMAARQNGLRVLRVPIYFAGGQV